MINIYIIGLLLILIIYLELTKKHRNIRGGNPEEDTVEKTLFGISIPIIVIVFIVCVGIGLYFYIKNREVERIRSKFGLEDYQADHEEAVQLGKELDAKEAEAATIIQAAVRTDMALEDTIRRGEEMLKKISATIIQGAMRGKQARTEAKAPAR